MMEIDSKWIVDYIKKKGLRIIIPKEATVIKSEALDSSIIHYECPEYDEDTLEEKVTVEFEQGSALEKIEPFAFRGVGAGKDIEIPKSVKTIGDCAFYGAPYSVHLEDDSTIEICESDFFFLNTKNVTVPPKLKKLYLSGLVEPLDTLTIPAESKLESIVIESGTNKVILQNGTELVAEDDESIRSVRLLENKIMVIFNKNENYYYKIMDLETQKTLKSGQVYNSAKSIFEQPVIEFDSVSDIDFDFITDKDYICLQTDYTGDKEEYKGDYWKIYGTAEGSIYGKEEAKTIKAKVEEIASHINVPPEGVKDREKIIYAQIVQELAKITQYDYEGAELIIGCNEEIYYYDEGETAIRIDETQNLKGLAKGTSVCGGYAAIINALTKYFGLSSQILVGKPDSKEIAHAWNLVTLDGETYEDDFTWYFDDLKAGNVPRIKTFLNGKMGNIRAMSSLNYHQLDKDIPVSKGISRTEKINLLATDWSNVQDWENVDIHKTNGLDSFVNQMEDFFQMAIVNLKDKIKKLQKRGEEYDGNR